MIPRLNFTGICLQDSPLGVRRTDGSSAFPAAINVAATFDKNLMYARGQAMGEEFRGKGINVALGIVLSLSAHVLYLTSGSGPMTNLMRAPASGRSWEGSYSLSCASTFIEVH